MPDQKCNVCNAVLTMEQSKTLGTCRLCRESSNEGMILSLTRARDEAAVLLSTHLIQEGMHGETYLLLREKFKQAESALAAAKGKSDV